MAKMRAVQVTKGGQPFEIVERDIPEPGPGMVRLRVQACGVCHSDVLTRDALWPGCRCRAYRGMRSSARWTSSATASSLD